MHVVIHFINHSLLAYYWNASDDSSGATGAFGGDFLLFPRARSDDLRAPAVLGPDSARLGSLTAVAGA